ncbi:hypothetical protein EC973_002392 [Apophysomyces ossiformis]|uniref:PHD-type domain-containing protein n=1 Tax=Apophysomyces ossiformis TaxID=679940 RepID=A0A8H7BGQ4_9FUNG|nr:hypothetical protein EC973_002392 [Apophysomyces ossiformis]
MKDVPDNEESSDHTGTDEYIDRGKISAISDNEAGDDSNTATGRKRGRPKYSTNAKDLEESEPKRRKEDENWENGEVIDSETDEAGEEKIDKEGRLRGDREYKVSTFTLPTRGDMLLMFAMDPAKVLGYRDSYLFFHKNPQLRRVRISEEEKKWLVEQKLLVSWFRNRDVAVVTARSVFKCFGSRIIKNGKRRRDDYFGIHDDEGEGELDESESDSSDTIARRSLIKKTPLSNDYMSSSPVNKATWMHHAALAVRGFNAQLHERRAEKPTFYDIHTNVNQVASATQPTSCTFELVENSEEQTPRTTHVAFENSLAKSRTARFQGVGKDLLESTYDNRKVLEVLPCNVRSSASDIISLHQPEIGPKAHQEEIYPLALIEGQYQASFPIHSTRFSQPEPKIISPSAVAATAQSIMAQQYYLNQVYQVVNNNMAAFAEQAASTTPTTQSPSLVRPPIAKASIAPQSSSPRPISIAGPTPPVPAPPVPPRPPKPVDKIIEPTLCGYITPKGQACKRTVMIPGEKCPAHAAASSTKPSTGDSKGVNTSQSPGYVPYALIVTAAMKEKEQMEKRPVIIMQWRRQCYDNFNEDRFCPICLKTFSEEDDNDDEDNEMVACDSCDHWIHTGCDETLTPEKYQNLCDDEEAKYLCPLCADSVKPLVHTGTAVMALKGLSAPSGYCVGMIGGKIKTRGVVNYKKIKLGVPEINGTGMAEMPRL